MGATSGDGQAAADAKAALLRKWVAGGERWLDVGGRSMWPTIRPPARVRLTAAGSPHRGEVWAFVADDSSVVVHRYRGATAAGHLFQGDGLAHRDPPVTPARLVARVVAVDDERGPRPLGRRDRWWGAARALWLRAVRRLPLAGK